MKELKVGSLAKVLVNNPNYSGYCKGDVVKIVDNLIGEDACKCDREGDNSNMCIYYRYLEPYTPTEVKEDKPTTWAKSKIGNPYNQYLIHDEKTGVDVALTYLEESGSEDYTTSNLIMAAPEMYKALKACLQALQEQYNSPIDLERQVYAALNKAEGK